MKGQRTFRRAIAPLVLLGVAAAPLAADSNIADPQKFAWAENVGWLNWADANTRIDGVEVYATNPLQYLEGWIWAENIGWIHAGDGNAPYANTDHTNYGVNISPATGEMSGYAWAENVGWISFGPWPPATTTPRPTWDHDDHRSRGYAWGENIGWINIDDMVRYLCAIPGDLDVDADVDVFDFGELSSNFGSSGHRSFTNGDCDGDGDVDVFDFGLFAANFGDACP